MQAPIETPQYLQLAADKCGFVREHYSEADMPTSLSNVTILPFFGDMRSQFLLTSLILPRYLSGSKDGRYFILASYPGLSGLFPYVDEYWSFADNVLVNELQEKTNGCVSEGDRALAYRRSLREYFRDVVTWEDDLAKYYENGLTKAYFDTFRQVQTYLPPLRSLRLDLNKQLANYPNYRIFIHPVKLARGWQGQHRTFKTEKAFWKDLLTSLVDEGFTPVVWQNGSCHDLSAEFVGRCVFLSERNIFDVLAVMRSCSLVLDIHSGLSRYAAVARCPYVVVEERQKFMGLKEFELDDLCVINKSYRYIFSFITILQNQQWSSLLDNIVIKINEMLPVLNRDEWPTTSEYSAIVPYSIVRNRKSKRIGSRFIKVPKI
jgi:hypothetical protein